MKSCRFPFRYGMGNRQFFSKRIGYFIFLMIFTVTISD